MDDIEILKIVKAGMVRVTGEQNINVSAEMKIFEDFDFDSLDFVEFVFHTEQLLGQPIRIDDILLDDSIKSLKTMTVGEYCHFLKKIYKPRS